MRYTFNDPTAPMSRDPVEVLYQGRYLSLKRRDDWEFAARTHPQVAVLIAWTGARELLLVEQFRPPIGSAAIELPAGLIGDHDHAESAEAAAARELEEETGYRAATLRLLMRCPTSAGMSDEQALFFLAQDLTRVDDGGGDDSEDIIVHRIPGQQVDHWLAEQYRAGKAIDPKIYTALYWSKK